jgi:hypothetical protein
MPSEEIKWVPHTPCLRVGVLARCSQGFVRDRIDCEKPSLSPVAKREKMQVAASLVTIETFCMTQNPTRRTDAWGTLVS